MFCVCLVLAVLLAPVLATAASCTDGVDCLCDCVTSAGTPGTFANAGCQAKGYARKAGVQLCEDFEAETLHENQGATNGAPLYGPWYDDTGFTGARGNNSYWHKTYGSSDGNCAWSSGEPASPTVGTSCAFGTCFAGEYRSDDLWQANTFACIDIIRAGEFDDEVGALGNSHPTGGGATGVFDGAQVMAHRVKTATLTGIEGRKTFPNAPLTTFGVTQATAYAANSDASGIWGSPWKHNEWAEHVTGYNDGVFLFHNGNDHSSQDPFQMFMRPKPGKTNADCLAMLAAARIDKGDVTCVSGFLYLRPGPGLYDQPTDWPTGAWGCPRAEYAGLNTNAATIKVWFNERLIIDVRNLNAASYLNASGGYDQFVWNGYANANQTGQGDTPTTATTYRYEDNVVVTNGTALTCAEIGFSTTPVTDPAIALSTSSISANAATGQNAASTSFTVTNGPAVGTLSYSLSDDMSWLTLSPTSGTSTGESNTIGVTYSTAALSPGTYTGTITVACSGTCTNSGQTISVSLTVTAVGVLGSLHANIPGAQGLSASNWVWSTYASGWTWEAMFKADTTTNAWKRLLSTRAATPDPNSSCWFAEDTSGKTRFEVAGSVTNGVQSTNTISSETSWHRYSLTFSGGTYTEYIDGTQVGQSTGKSNPTSASDGPIRLNDCYLDNGSGLGRVADVRLLSAAKSSAWIGQHKDCRLKPGTAGLVDYWRLDEVSGTTVANTATTSTHGNITLSGGLVMDNGDTPALVGVAGSDCVDAANPAPTITTSVSTLSPSTTAGTNASPASFTVTNTGGGTAVYSISDDVTWMSQSPSFGTTTAETDTVNVTYDAAGLTAAGSPYTGHIYLYDPAANPDTKTITVTMTVTAQAPAQITLSPTTLAPAAVTVGSSPSAGSFTVTNTGVAGLSYTISDDQSWISESPTSGTSTGESDTIAVTYATNGLSAGTYQATITVTDAAAVPTSQTLTATVAIQAAAPIISLSTSELSASAGAGRPIASSAFQIRNSGGGILQYAVTSPTTWITLISPASGASSGESDLVYVYVDTNGMLPGTYVGSISVADAAATNTPQTLTLTLKIDPLCCRQ